MVILSWNNKKIVVIPWISWVTRIILLSHLFVTKRQALRTTNVVNKPNPRAIEERRRLPGNCEKIWYCGKLSTRLLRSRVRFFWRIYASINSGVWAPPFTRSRSAVNTTVHDKTELLRNRRELQAYRRYVRCDESGLERYI